MKPDNKTKDKSNISFSILYRYTATAVILWTIIIGGLLAWDIHNENEQAIELANKEASTIFSKDLAFRTWTASHGGVYVPPDERTPPNPYLSHVPERDITTTTGKSLTLMNPAYVMQQVMGDYERLYGVKGHITSLKLLNPVNAPDEWERNALLTFEQDATEISEVIDIDGLLHIRHMQPLITEEACLKCHGDQSYKVGDIRGGVSVAVPMTAYFAIAREDISAQIWTHGIIFFFGLAGIGFISTRSKQHIVERNRAEEELRKSHRSVEKKVEQRTAELTQSNIELAAANEEMESFSYSVSHDLRTPLRSIDGFTQIVLEDYSDKLGEQGKNNLQRVRSVAQRMGVIIDDLLALSRVTRSDMKREPVDLSALAEEITAELRDREPERQIEFVTVRGLTANGDINLLRILLENLLGNAWKFTGKHPKARIEFGVTQVDNEEAFFIRDDGAGFNMNYANKLFGMFQRLHEADEFQGTGIGLATVQRIVHRHGGRIWAEGEVEKGATFYFTL